LFNEKIFNYLIVYKTVTLQDILSGK